VPGDIQVQQPPDHGLIVGLVLPGLLLEKIDTGPAKADGDLDAFLLKGQLAGRRKEILYHPQVAQGLIGVAD